jgi:hypothetical protein
MRLEAPFGLLLEFAVAVYLVLGSSVEAGREGIASERRLTGDQEQDILGHQRHDARKIAGLRGIDPRGDQ